MLFSNILLFLGGVQAIAAHRPEHISMCDYYTTSIFTNNTAVTQEKFIARLFNEAVRGNYTGPNVGVPVPGFATPAVYNGSWINLIQYFTGQLNSTNRGGAAGISQVFLDDGGPVPLGMDLPSNGNISSNQYKLFTHAYWLWAELLGCSLIGTTAQFPLYDGKQSMYEVHKYMNLDPLELGFFNAQNVLSAFAIGFSMSDAAEFGDILNSLFSYRCSPPRKIAPSDVGTPSLQSICISSDCPIDPNGGDCSLYPNDGKAVLLPTNITLAATSSENVTTTSVDGSSIPTSMSGTTASSAAKSTSAAILNKVERAHVYGGIMATIAGVIFSQFA